MATFWNRGWVSTKGTHANNFTAGQDLLEFTWVKETVPGSDIVVEALPGDNFLGFVITPKGALQGNKVDVLLGEWKDSGSGAGGSGYWTPQGITNFTVGGIPAGTNLGILPITVEQTLIDMLYGYLPPTTTLVTNPAGGLRETGDLGALGSIDLTSVTTMNSLPITTFVFKKNGVTIYTSPAPNPLGGVETFTDATGVSGNTIYQAVVGDGIGTGTASVTFSFTLAYYYGVGAPGLTPAQVASLTKNIIVNTSPVARIFNPTNQVYYFAYPAAYPALTSILDTNGFQTIPDWTVTIANITNVFGVTASYRIYEFNNLTTQVNFTNTFIQ